VSHHDDVAAFLRRDAQDLAVGLPIGDRRQRSAVQALENR
jgi:hypothetical protein